MLPQQTEIAAQFQQPFFLSLAQRLGRLAQREDTFLECHGRILRTVLEEIVVKNTDEPPQHVLHLHWKGGVHTELRASATERVSTDVSQMSKRLN